MKNREEKMCFICPAFARTDRQTKKEGGAKKKTYFKVKVITQYVSLKHNSFYGIYISNLLYSLFTQKQIDLNNKINVELITDK